MMISRITPLAVAVAALSITGCEGMRDALTAHTSLAARAEGQQLTANRLGELLGNSEAPMERDVVRALADIWVNYQLLGVAAARGDSLNDTALVDSAMWAAVAGYKARQFYDRVSADWARVDSAAAPEAYARGDLLAAEHILLMTQNVPDEQRAAKLQGIRSIRARATSANFSQLAREFSEDQGSAVRGGALGVFPRGAMVPPFEQAVLRLAPGEISDVVETQFGYHIVRRQTYAEVRDEFLDGLRQLSVQRAESLYTDRMDSLSRVEIRRNAAQRARTAALDMDSHRTDRTVLASSTAGPFTVARLVQWLETFPPTQQVVQRMVNAPDTTVEQLIKNFVRNEIVVRAADSAGIAVDSEELSRIRNSFHTQVEQTWMQLRIHPSQLADSAGTRTEREQLASRRVEAYVEAMLAGRAPFVPIVAPLQSALRTRYDARVNSAGLDRAFQIAQRQRVAADAARQQTESAVPLPQAPGQPAPQGGRGDVMPQGVPGQPAPQGPPDGAGNP
jgi:parvulin-like peptidyl-prolyl isomerase